MATAMEIKGNMRCGGASMRRGGKPRAANASFMYDICDTRIICWVSSGGGLALVLPPKSLNFSTVNQYVF